MVSNDIKKALVIGAETLSKSIDWNDRSTCVLFGDGAGAVLYKLYLLDLNYYLLKFALLDLLSQLLQI